MKDSVYREFMINLLTNLEPIFGPMGSSLAVELDEMGQVIFITKGKVGLGCEVNKIKKLYYIYKDKYIVGAYECTFN